MKTRIRHYSMSAFALVLAFCMLVSCMTVGIVATDAAVVSDSGVVGGYSGESVGAGGTVTTNHIIYIMPSQFWTDYSSYTIKANVKFGNNDSDGWSQVDFSDTGNTYNGLAVYSANTSEKYGGAQLIQIQKYDGSTWKAQEQINGWIGLSTYENNLYDKDNSSWIANPSWDVVATPLTEPTLKYNNSTSSPVTINAGETATLTWAAVSHASSYTIYKDGTAVESGNTSRTYTASTTGEYTVKAIGDGTNYSDSDASNAIQVNIPIEFYIHNTANWDANKLEYYLYGGSEAAGGWEGTYIKDDMGASGHTELIGTSGGHNVYKVTIVTNDSYIILIENQYRQTKGNNDSNSALANGKVYTTVDVDNASTTSCNFSDLVMDAPKHNVTISNSITNGTVTVDDSSVGEGSTTTIRITPDFGYELTSITASGTGSLLTGSGDTRTLTMGTADVTINATFSAISTTKTFYIVNSGDWENVYYYVYSGGNAYSVWPGTQLTNNEKIGVHSLKDVYSVTVPSYYTHIILNVGSNATQYDGDGAVALTDGKIYPTQSGTPSNLETYSASYLDSTHGITYTGSNVTWGGTKPATAYPGETVSFTATAAENYRITQVKYNDGSSDHTLTASNGTYSFTMPSSAVTVTVTTIRTYTVTLSAGTGFNSTKYYFVGATPGTYSTYSSAITVDSGSTVYFKVSYVTGYEYDSVSNATVYTANTVFKIASVTSNTTVTLTAKKTQYTVSTAAKGSNNGSSYGTDLTSNVTITTTGITSGKATRVDGFSATAPSTVTISGVKYNFAQWAMTKCSLKTGSSATNTTASFVPIANGAVATAQYKKVYTVTIGDNEAGEGNGTVTSNKSEVEAGGSYTITLQPDEYSVADKLKINGDEVSLTASGTAKTYTGTANGNVTAVGRFTTDVKLGNKYFDGTGNWITPAMTSNGDGTYSYVFTNQAATGNNSPYQFKVVVGSTYKDYTTDTVFDDGETSSTLGSINDGGINYELTLSEQATVTIVYTADQNKITSVALRPTNSTRYTITVGSPDNMTLTATYRGVTYNEGQSITVRANQTLSVSATTRTSGYFVTSITVGSTSLTVTDNGGNVYTATHTIVAADDGKTLNAVATPKFEVKKITYYVDMHANAVENNLMFAVTNASGTVVQTDLDDALCSKAMSRVNSSCTVYSVEVNTPLKKDANSNYLETTLRITNGTTAKTVHLTQADVSGLAASSSPEVWIEALNESANTYKVTYKPNTTTAVESGKKRIYVAKPNSWQNEESSEYEPSWKNLHLYHWGDYTDIGWSSAPEMTYIGYDSNYHYYYVDIDSDINNIIFQGWKDNSDYPDVQTGNIENIGSSNYFILSKDGGSYVGTKGENATPPGYTRYVNRVDMNVRDTANITPTHTGAKVTYSSNNANVTVTDGVVSATASADATITVKVYGTVGAKATGNDAGDIKDVMTYTVTVSVRNPGIFSGFKVMSFASQVYTVTIPTVTVTIPTVSSTQPGYFVLDDNKTSVVVNGLYDGSGYTAKYSNSAIITPKTYTTVNNENVPTSFTVKYAASNSSEGYSNIVLNDAMVTTVSIKKPDAKRFGFKEWTPSQASITTSKVINNGVETVTHKGLAFAGTATYQAIFEEYDYVDVTFNFKYDEYVPQKVNEYEEINGEQTLVRTITNYQYDSTWAEQDGAHTTKEYEVSGYEVRNQTTSTITPSNLVTPAVAAIEALPSNDYYNYKIESSGITINSTGGYVATVTVVMTKSVRTYSVYLNGAEIRSDYTYQAYADLNTGNTVSKWYAVKDDKAAINEQSPLLATGTGYKFRVKGNTYLRTQEGTLDNDSFNRSENGFANYEITHRQSGSAMKEYLLQNFYIADFFDQDKVKDLERGDGSKADEANFVGGGVVYYSVTDNQPYSKAVDAGYVNAGDGTAVASEIKTMLKRNIEANYNNYEDLAAAVGEEEAMKVVYGQAIPVTNNTENGAKTGVMYRYLPLENYTVDANNNITKELNSDVFRYSNSLQSYQYIYASGNENKATNSGKNMRLYSYYIYSYRTYDKDTNLPKLNYEVVLSDQYSDASTYWAGNPNNPNS